MKRYLRLLSLIVMLSVLFGHVGSVRADNQQPWTNWSNIEPFWPDSKQSAAQTELLHLRSQAREGNVKAQLNLGLKYVYGQEVSIDYQKAAQWFRTAAKRGNALARYNLGLLYYYGLGVPGSYVKATHYFQTAADQGNSLAQFNLGLMYYKGEGVVQSYQKAARWYRRAAEQGNPVAQYNLGLLYDDGIGVPQNDIESYKWLRLAAFRATGTLRQWALDNCETMAHTMTASQISQAQELAVAWHPNSGPQKHPNLASFIRKQPE